MMMFCKKKVIYILIFAAILLIINSGCSNIFKRSDENQSKQTQDTKKSPPKTLTSLEDTTETIIKDIQEVKDKQIEAVQLKQEEPKKEGQQGNNQEQKQQEDKPKEEEQSKDQKKPQEDEQKDEEQSQKKEEKPEDKQTKSATIDWKKMEEHVEKLQSSWNSYVNVATKDGASNDLIKNFENQLDLLTTKIMEQQEASLLDAVNDLYKFYPRFYDLYKHQAPPNVKDMKYYVRKIIIDSENYRWSENKESIDSLRQAWETAKSRMEKPDRDTNQKIDAAIDSFSRSVGQQNIHLIKMKGDILIKGIEEIK